MHPARDGDLYKRIELYGKVFEIFYGYYEEFEKESAFGEPTPIYPDFLKHPAYTPEGCPFTTQMQPLCAFGDSKFPDGCCIDCSHFSAEYDLFGICKCPQKQLPNHETEKLCER